MAEIEIVDQQQIDAGKSEPLEAVLVGAGNAGGGVVEPDLERQPADPRAGVEGIGIGGSGEDAADLGRDGEAAPRLATQEVAHAVLAETPPVPRRGVEIGDAPLVRSGERRLGVALG